MGGDVGHATVENWMKRQSGTQVQETVDSTQGWGRLSQATPQNHLEGLVNRSSDAAGLGWGWNLHFQQVPK